MSINLAYRAARANRVAAIAAAETILAKHQYVDGGYDGLGNWVACLCKGGFFYTNDLDPQAIATAMAQHQAEAMRDAR